MTMSLLQIIAAILMVGAVTALVLAFRRYTAVASERRMAGMLARVGLDPATVSSGDNEAILKEIRQRCRTCTAEDVCERWLAGEEEGDNAFCPNAKVFDALHRTSGAVS